MNLYHISQVENRGWDTFSDAVVVAESEEDARKITPHGDYVSTMVNDPPSWEGSSWCWASSPDHVTAVLIGVATDGRPAGTVICASFHAG